MNNILVLTKVLLKTGKGSKNSSNKWKNVALYVFIGICLLPLIGTVVSLTAVSTYQLAKIHQEGLVLAIGVALSCAIVMLFGIFYVLSTFYFSQDIEHLLPLPLKPYEILFSKFIVVLLFELITELFFLAPLLVTFGVASGAGIVYYLYAILVYFTLPVIPLVIDAVVLMVIMRFTNLGKHKDILRVVAGVLGIAFGAGIQIFSNRMAQGEASKVQSVQDILKNNNSLVDTVTRIFPSSKIVVSSLINSDNLKGLVNILLYIAITIALLAIMNVLGEALYFKGVIGGNQSATSGKKVTEREIEASTVQSSALKSYTIKELKLVFRTPAYFLNCVLINLIMPVFFIGPAMSNHGKLGKLVSTGAFMKDPKVASIVLAGAFAFTIFMSAVNPTASTAISREGKNLFTAKYMPVSYKTQILGKVLSAVALNLMGLIILLLAAISIVKLSISYAVLILIAGVLAIIFTAFIGILIDLNFPKLEWDDEQRAVKQNMNVVFSMLIGIVAGGAAVALLILLSRNILITFAIIFVIFGIADLILYGIISTIGVEVFEKLEG